MTRDLPEVPAEILASAVNSVRQWNRKGILTVAVDPQTCQMQAVVRVNGQQKVLPSVLPLFAFANDTKEAVKFLIAETGIAYSANIFNQIDTIELIFN